jgi:hypothetical protein
MLLLPLRNDHFCVLGVVVSVVVVVVSVVLTWVEMNRTRGVSRETSFGETSHWEEITRTRGVSRETSFGATSQRSFGATSQRSFGETSQRGRRKNCRIALGVLGLILISWAPRFLWYTQKCLVSAKYEVSQKSEAAFNSTMTRKPLSVREHNQSLTAESVDVPIADTRAASPTVLAEEEVQTARDVPPAVNKPSPLTGQDVALTKNSTTASTPGENREVIDALQTRLHTEWESFVKENSTELQKELSLMVERAATHLSSGDETEIYVSICTFASADRLVRLKDMVTRWTGPIEAAVYVSGPSDIESFVNFYAMEKDLLAGVNFHVLLENTGTTREKELLPENALRNLAQHQAQTRFLIHLDPEYVTSKDAYETLQKALRTNPRFREFLKDNFVMALPAFESRRKGETLDAAPGSKQEVLKAKANNTVAFTPMPGLKAGGRNPINVYEWSKLNFPGDFYKTDYEDGYVPYYLVAREGLADHRANMRGPWNGRRAWIEEARELNYKFGVLRWVFVYRIDPTIVPVPEDWVEDEWQIFRKNLKGTYHYPLEVDTVQDISSRKHDNCVLDSAMSEIDGFSGTEAKVLCEWQNFTKSDARRRQIVAVLGPRERSSIDGDISLATQGSVDRLDRLLDGTKRWNGPISAAIYVKSSSSIRDLVEFVRANKRALKHTTFHLFFEKMTIARDKLYPHNYLRNLAMNHINTDYFICMDMDFVFNEGSYDGLVNLVQTDEQVRSRLDNRTMLVLPAFENSHHPDHEDLSLAPIDKAQLVKQVKTTKEAEAFHLSKYRPGHGATNFEKWYANKTKTVYDISYEKGFEPYALGRKGGSLPQFWPGFRGFGMNKRSWYEELHRAGYRYGVLRDFFVFHIGKSSTTNVVSPWVVYEYEKKFTSYLDTRYPQK